jgi:hypothetical protein
MAAALQRLAFEVACYGMQKCGRWKRPSRRSASKLRKGGVGLFILLDMACKWLARIISSHRCPNQPRTGRALRDDTGWTYIGWHGRCRNEVSLLFWMPVAITRLPAASGPERNAV